MLTRRTLLSGAACMAAVGFRIAPAWAQAFPSRTIKIIVPTPAGGPVDTMARILVNALPQTIGQPVIIENRAGAGNTIGSKAAAAADPDGYTLSFTAASGLIMSPMLYKSAGYDATNFAPVALFSETPEVLVVHPSLPVTTIAELVAYAKARPGELNYSTGGAGTLPHLTMEQFKKEAGIDIKHVPYKGGGPALMDAIAGQVQMTFDVLGTSLPFIQSGKLRVLALVGEKRSPKLPDTPTMPEAGFPTVTSGAWTALLAPAATPATVIAKLNQATNEAIKTRDVQEAMDKLGAEPRGGAPDVLARMIRSETAKWTPIVAALGLKGE